MSSKTKLQIEAFILVALCALVRVFRGKAETAIKNPKVIAVAHFTTNLGDMIMATPVFRAIKSSHPDCKVVVVGSGKNGELLAGNTDIDEYIPARDFWSALGKLSRIHPDMGVALNPSPHEIALLYLSGARGVSVFFHEAFQSRAYRALSQLVSTVLFKTNTYIPSLYLKLLEPLGIKSADTTKYLAVSDSARERVRQELKRAGVDSEAPLVALSAGAGQDFREWRIERFAEVAKYARDAHGAGLAFLGGPMDKRHAKEFKDALPNIPVFDGTGQSIEELKALVSLAKAVVSNDSGVAYIAEAFNVPSVIIVGPSDAAEHPLGSPLARVVVPDNQRYVIHSLVDDLSAVDTDSARQQLDSIPASRVTKELDRALKGKA